MICKFCEKEIDKDSKFCKHCGKNVVEQNIVLNIKDLITQKEYKIELIDEKTYKDILISLYKKLIIPKSKICLESSLLISNSDVFSFKNNSNFDNSIIFNGANLDLYYDEDEELEKKSKRIQYLYGCPNY